MRTLPFCLCVYANRLLQPMVRSAPFRLSPAFDPLPCVQQVRCELRGNSFPPGGSTPTPGAQSRLFVAEETAVFLIGFVFLFVGAGSALPFFLHRSSPSPRRQNGVVPARVVRSHHTAAVRCPRIFMAPRSLRAGSVRAGAPKE